MRKLTTAASPMHHVSVGRKVSKWSIRRLVMVVGYLRLTLLAIGWYYIDQSTIFSLLYGISASLDLFDGYFARRLKQTSSFGAWLDVIADNIGRTMLWTQVARWGWMIIVLEWSSFVCTHCRGANWKGSFERAPWLVTKVMDNGFYTPLGILVILGLHALPLALYVKQDPPYGLELKEYHLVLYCILGLFTVGRTICAFVEDNIVTPDILYSLWTVYEHVQQLVSDDIDQQLSSLTDDLQKSRHNSSS